MIFSIPGERIPRTTSSIIYLHASSCVNLSTLSLCHDIMLMHSQLLLHLSNLIPGFRVIRRIRRNEKKDQLKIYYKGGGRVKLIFLWYTTDQFAYLNVFPNVTSLVHSG